VLKITIEMIPFGEEKNKRLLHTITIGNVKTKNNISNYSVKLDEVDKGILIKSFPRSLGMFELLKRVLGKLLQEERKNGKS